MTYNVFGGMLNPTLLLLVLAVSVLIFACIEQQQQRSPWRGLQGDLWQISEKFSTNIWLTRDILRVIFVISMLHYYHITIVVLIIVINAYIKVALVKKCLQDRCINITTSAGTVVQ